MNSCRNKCQLNLLKYQISIKHSRKGKMHDTLDLVLDPDIRSFILKRIRKLYVTLRLLKSAPFILN